MIIVAILGLLTQMKLSDEHFALHFIATGALPALVLVTAFYMSGSLLWGTAMGIVLTIFYAVALWIPVLWHIVLFFSGWALQFVGHIVFEKKSPSFFKNLIHLLIGPLYILMLLWKQTEKLQRDS